MRRPLWTNTHFDKFAEQVRYMWGQLEIGSSSISADATLGREQAVKVDATSAARTITLPLASRVPGRAYFVWKSDTSVNTVTVARSGSDTIEDATSRVLSYQYAHTFLVSDGVSTWKDIVGIGTAAAVQETSGRGYVTVSGNTAAGAVELITQEADAAGVTVGVLQFTDRNSTSGDRRAATVSTVLRGTTGNNRGGELRFHTKSDAGGLSLRGYITENGSVIIGSGASALATTATDGFLYIPTCAGAPTGVPTTQTGTVALIFDTTNNRLYIYDGAWIYKTIDSV